ncbi:MAG: hypothetical protein ACTIAY_10185, partial [Microbacterium gubbeenense]
GWYPYYFLDLRQVSGLTEFCLTCLFALAVFAGVASGLILLSRGNPRIRLLRRAASRERRRHVAT